MRCHSISAIDHASIDGAQCAKLNQVSTCRIKRHKYMIQSMQGPTWSSILAGIKQTRYVTRLLLQPMIGTQVRVAGADKLIDCFTITVTLPARPATGRPLRPFKGRTHGLTLKESG